MDDHLDSDARPQALADKREHLLGGVRMRETHVEIRMGASRDAVDRAVRGVEGRDRAGWMPMILGTWKLACEAPAQDSEPLDQKLRGAVPQPRARGMPAPPLAVDTEVENTFFLNRDPVQRPAVRHQRHPAADPCFAEEITDAVHSADLLVTGDRDPERGLGILPESVAELSVYGQAIVVLRRKPSENLLLVGDNQPAAVGMLAAILCATAINENPKEVKIRILDRSVPGTPWNETLGQVVDGLLKPLGYDAEVAADAKKAVSWLDECVAEIDRRLVADENDLIAMPTWLLMISGADRVTQLLKTQSKFGTPVNSGDGEKLARIYQEGPAVGIHLIISFPGAAPLAQVLGRDQLDRFKHRVATQMSESDSFLILGKDRASKLQKDASTPIMAAFQDVSRTKVFKPYVSNPQISWEQQIGFVRERVERWEKGQS